MSAHRFLYSTNLVVNAPINRPSGPLIKVTGNQTDGLGNQIYNDIFAITLSGATNPDSFLLNGNLTGSGPIMKLNYTNSADLSTPSLVLNGSNTMNLNSNSITLSGPTINLNGNVGIRRTIPAYPLDVNGSAKFTNIIDDDNLSGTAGDVLSSTGGAISWISQSSIITDNATSVFTSMNSNDITRFICFKPAVSGNLADFTNPNLTYNPYTNLLIGGTFSGALIGNATTCTNATNSIITQDISSPEGFIPFVNTSPTTGGSPQPLKANSSLKYNPSTNFLTVSGIVGIGTITPISNLDLNGTININGNLTVSGPNINLTSDNLSVSGATSNFSGTNLTARYTNSITLSGPNINLTGDNLNVSGATSNFSGTLYCPTFSGALIGNATNSTNAVISAENADTTCFIPFVNNAPSGTAQPLKGNNSLTYNAQVNSLTVSGSNGITVINSGFPGITINTGAESRQALLEVNGGGISYSHLLLRAQSKLIAIYANPQVSGATGPSGMYKYTGDTSGICYLTNSITSGFVFNDGLNERARFNNSGFLGIGTSTPTERLDVSGTINATLFKTGGAPSNTAGFINSVYLESNVPSLTFSNTGVNGGKYTLGATNGNFGIWDNNIAVSGAVVSGAYAFTINSSSNIGIGTNTPSARLDLKYDSPDTSFSTQIPNGIRIHNTNPTVNAIGALSFSASVFGTAVGAVGIVNAVGSGSATNLGRLALYTKPTTTSLLTEKMTILGDGNVGIGTTNPQAKLDVATGNDGVSAIFSSANGVNNYNSIQLRGGTLGTTVNWSVAKDASTANSLQIIPSTVSGGTTFTGSSAVLTIKNDGKVGIGTITPSEKLNVVGGLVPLKIEPTTSGTDGVSLTLGYSGIKFNSTAPSYKTFSIQNELNDPNATISLLQNTTSGPKGITIKNDGNVGIGTTTPANKLDVRGVTRITNDDGQSMLFVEWINATGPSPTILNALVSAGGGYGELQTRGFIQTFYTNTDVSPITPTERMRITSIGRVGIGTSGPSTLFDVNGEGSFGFQDFRTQATQRVLTLRAEPVSGFYSQSRYNFYTKPGTTSNGVSTLSIRSQYGGDAESADLFTLSGNGNVTVSGNVGIGTTPSTKLHIVGGNFLMGGSFEGMLMNPGSGAGSLAITRSGNFINNVQQINAPYTDNVGGTSGGGAQISLLKNEMTFSTYPNPAGVGNAITLTERMRITSTGVGINTTNPVYKLQVEGSGTANEIVGWFNNQGAFSSSIAVRQSSKTAYITNHYGLGTPSYDGQLSNAISFGVSSGSSPIQFYNGNTGVGLRGTAKLTILENGNTGIGTTTPSVQLELSTDGAKKLTTSTWTISSDQRVKTNIENANLVRCNEIIENLNLKHFTWDEKYFPDVDDRHSLGFIAQEVETFFPNAVKTHNKKFLIKKGDTNGAEHTNGVETDDTRVYEEFQDFKSLDIDQLIKCLFGSVKFLQGQVKSLEERISKLE